MKICACILLVLSFMHGTSQAYETDNLNLEGNIAQWFDRAIGQQNTFLIIREGQENYSWPKTSHPYYLSNQWLNGNVTIQGQTFYGLELLFNIEKEQILLRDVQYRFNPQPIAINNDAVDGFVIDNRSFLRLDQLDDKNGGFVEVLVEGEYYSLYVRRIKEERITSSEIIFNRNDEFFLRKEGDIFRIRNRKALFDLLAVDTDDKQWIKSKKLKLFKNEGEDLKMFVSYLDQTM